MKTLWTPDGEKPITTEKKAGPAKQTTNEIDQSTMSEEDINSLMEKVRENILNTPVEDLIINHMMGLAEIVAVHLNENEPDLEAARLGIDTVDAILSSIGKRLDNEKESAFRSILSELQMVWVSKSK